MDNQSSLLREPMDFKLFKIVYKLYYGKVLKLYLSCTNEFNLLHRKVRLKKMEHDFPFEKSHLPYI